MTPTSLLFDSNAFFACINVSKYGIHPDAHQATRLMELAHSNNCEVWLTAATKRDILRAGNPKKREASILRMRQWKVLEPLRVSDELLARAGYSKPLSDNDDVDTHMLAALDAAAVDFLVTQDKTLRRHADDAGFGDRVFSIQGAIDLLERLYQAAAHFPSVSLVKAYQLDPTDEIFTSLREDYGEEFGPWFDKARRERRDCLIITGSDGTTLDALTILKTEEDRPHGLPGHVLKICTFKVADHASGAKRGELLLKAAFDHATKGHHTAIYVEVFAKHDPLVRLLEAFGFDRVASSTSRGELVLAKHLRPGPHDNELDPLEYHRRFGPPAVLVDQAFAVPIQPRWHRDLFPEYDKQHSLFSPASYGNAILKAYLSKSAITTITDGAVLLFYRSEDAKAITAVGVVEGQLRSDDPAEVRRFVGQRTVYSDAVIQEMCANGPILALLFRHDRLVEPVWTLDQLVETNVLAAAPQSIQQITDQGALSWIRAQLDAP